MTGKLSDDADAATSGANIRAVTVMTRNVPAERPGHDVGGGGMPSEKR